MVIAMDAEVELSRGSTSDRSGPNRETRRSLGTIIDKYHFSSIFDSNLCSFPLKCDLCFLDFTSMSTTKPFLEHEPVPSTDGFTSKAGIADLLWITLSRR